MQLLLCFSLLLACSTLPPLICILLRSGTPSMMAVGDPLTGGAVDQVSLVGWRKFSAVQAGVRNAGQIGGKTTAALLECAALQFSGVVNAGIIVQSDFLRLLQPAALPLCGIHFTVHQLQKQRKRVTRSCSFQRDLNCASTLTRCIGFTAR